MGLVLVHLLQKYINRDVEGAWFMDFVWYCWLFYGGIFIFRYMCGLSKGIETLFALAGCLLMHYLQLGLPSLLLVVFGAWAIVFLKSKWAVTDFIGKISYSLYLTHHTAGLRFLNLGLRMHLNASGRLMLYFASLLFCILIAWLFYLLIEKPSLKWAERLSYRDKEPAL